MAITFGGLSSGLPPNIVDQLLQAERIPIQNLENKKVKAETKLGLVNELTENLTQVRGKIADLASTRGFTDIKLISGDPNIIQGTVDPDQSVSGSWNVEVMRLAQKAAAVTNGFPDKDTTEIGVGYFRFETADGDKEVYIGGENNTLQGAANAINSANVGLRASVINDRKTPDAPFKLLISGSNVGEDNEIKYPTLYFLDGDQDLYFDENKAAQNGVIKVDGFEFEITDNSVKDIIPGVTLELKQAQEGRSVNVTVKEDQEVVSGKIKEFVDTMNAALGFIQTQSRIDANTDTSQTLGGDGILRTVENRLRRLIQGTQVGVNSNIRRLQQIGIEFNRNGTLDFDEDKFNNTLARSPQAVQNFFAGDGFSVGFIPTLRREVGNILDQSFGPLPMRRKSLQDNIRRIDQRIDTKEKQLVKKEASLRRKFAKLEENMSRLKSQGGQLGALGSVPNFGSPKVG